MKTLVTLLRMNTRTPCKYLVSTLSSSHGLFCHGFWTLEIVGRARQKVITVPVFFIEWQTPFSHGSFHLQRLAVFGQLFPSMGASSSSAGMAKSWLAIYLAKSLAAVPASHLISEPNTCLCCREEQQAARLE
jgi:hypothetical protein